MKAKCHAAVSFEFLGDMMEWVAVVEWKKGRKNTQRKEKRQSEICCESQAFVVEFSVGSAGAVWEIIVSECSESESEDGRKPKRKKNTK